MNLLPSVRESCSVAIKVELKTSGKPSAASQSIYTLLLLHNSHARLQYKHLFICGSCVALLQGWTISHMQLCRPSKTQAQWHGAVCFTTDGSSVAMLFFFLQTSQWAVNQWDTHKYTPNWNNLALACVCDRAVNSWTCMCTEHAALFEWACTLTLTHLFLYFTTSSPAWIVHLQITCSRLTFVEPTTRGSCQRSDTPLCCNPQRLPAVPTQHRLMSAPCPLCLNQYVRLCNLRCDLFLLRLTYTMTVRVGWQKSYFSEKNTCNRHRQVDLWALGKAAAEGVGGNGRRSEKERDVTEAMEEMTLCGSQPWGCDKT